MGFVNVDAECYEVDSKKQREYQEDWLETGYAPLKMEVNGPCIFYRDGIYHSYLIVGTPGVGCCAPGNQIILGHATTTDFSRWETHEPALYVDPNGWDYGHLWNPYIVERDGRFWMLYTGAPLDNTQRIGIAVSDDLYGWKRLFNEPVIRPEEYGWAHCPRESGAACRDPYVVLHEDEYWMYYTATMKEGNGCVARAVSRDLLHWVDAGPFFARETFIKCEDPVVIQTDGHIHLIFNSWLDPLNRKGSYGLWSVACENLHSCETREPKQVASGEGCFAVDLINRKNQNWLISYVKPTERGMRMFIGALDVSAETMVLKQISHPDQVAPFLSEG